MHLRQIEGVLLEDLGEDSKLARFGPVVVDVEPVHRCGWGPLAVERRKVEALHYAGIVTIAVGPEAIVDSVQSSPWMEVRE